MKTQLNQIRTDEMNRSTLDAHRSAVVEPSPGAVIVDVTLLSIAILFGFAGNARVCFLLKRRQDLRKVPHFLFFSLAANGVLSSLVALPSRLATATLNHHFNRPQYAEHACNVAIPSTFVCGIVNAVTLSLMAIDRQDCVLRPFDRRMTPSNIKAIIAISWTATLVLSSVIIFSVLYYESVCHQFSLKGLFTKIPDKHSVFIYYICLGFACNIASLLISVITAIRIIVRLRSSPLPDSQSLHRRQENKLTWLTYKICGLFFVCWLPQIICTFVLFGGIRGITIIDALVIVSTVSYYYYALNPLLFYNLLNRRTGNIAPRPADRQAMGKQMNALNDDRANFSNNIPRQEDQRQGTELAMNCSDIDQVNNANRRVDVEVYDTHL